MLISLFVYLIYFGDVGTQGGSETFCLGWEDRCLCGAQSHGCMLRREDSFVFLQLPVSVFLAGQGEQDWCLCCVHQAQGEMLR